MYVGNYAERDAELTLALWKVMQKEISDQDLGSIFDLETDLLNTVYCCYSISLASAYPDRD